MKGLSTKRPRLRLDPKAYRNLCRKVLKRDQWRCQLCGRIGELQVHHIRMRSKLGDDIEVNLITLCARCHCLVHGRRARKAPTC